ncbi:hypothetical protein CAPTEDRAFT_93285 [Capitella teleta]|uniref:Integrin beta n=1 Tax=Capitella teleta TaxID=283909 RepID=X2BBX2_CAPTE|nr:hypothetical protein CAPTEDRAFT_93285 [Capitella teleta]|eukprot:ELU10143.1 hypothetical protein CAPTEDRAFT_93285 [Capitella teleta]
MAFHNAEAEEEAIQLSPQKVSIKLRPNDPFTFPVQFRQAKNYPVDLYFVMDLSKSMQDDKQEISLLGDLLAGEMGKLTNNFKLGFGSFVDKETYPFIGIDGMWMRHLCKGEVCEPPYEFRNNLPLTKDTHLFKKRVNETNISVNMDKPEGGLDAIMQAVVCDQEIGWRNSSRKVLLFTTDDSFHHAGDGRLGGIVTPNDGLCHLDAEGRYNESLNQDYPSIGHLASVIASKKVNVIFAVIEKFVPLYSSLSSMIEGSMVGELANDSSNVVDLVRDNYNKISGTVELKADENDDVFVGFKAQCEEWVNGEFGPGTKCGNIGIGQNVTFEVTIEVMSCPTNPSERKRSFFIYPVGLNEKLLVEVETTCECECEKPGVGVRRMTAKCNGTGTFECGACSCTSGTFGKNCECSASEMDHDHFSVSCKRSNTSKVVCEGRGQCYCGHCECFPLTPDDPSRKYDGRFCECNNYACDFFEEELCGGPSRGTCKCGKCECRPGLTGPACDCATDQEACRAKENGLLCNGKGECVCGACVCDQNDHYRGPTCEDCPICPGKCDEFRACVQCTAFESGEITKENCDANCTYVEIVDQIEGWRLCTFRDVDDCDFYFTYSYLLDGVFVQRTKECPPPVKLLAIVFGTIAGTILIGLTLLFLWKFCVTFIDKKEFEKFEKEQKKIQWEMDENPLYQEASATFSNPTYIN